MNGVIAHVIGPFSGGLLIERKPPGDLVHLQDDGLPTETSDPDNNIGLQTTEEGPSGETHRDVKEAGNVSTHNGGSVAETFDRRTLDITVPVLGSLSTQCSHTSTDVFDKEASAERSSGEYAAYGRTPGIAVDAEVLTDSQACESTLLDSRPPYVSATDERADRRHTRRVHGAPRDGAILQPDLIISSGIAGAGGCGGGFRQLTTRELPASDSDNIEQIRRLCSSGAGAEAACIGVEEDDDGIGDNDGHAALVIAERVWHRSFYENQWEFHYPAAGDGATRGSSSSSSRSSSGGDKRAAARRRVRIGSGDAAYHKQTSPSEESGGDGGGWQEPSDSVAAAELSDDVFLASTGRRNGSLNAASEDSSSRRPDNYRADNNCTDTYGYDKTASTVAPANADINHHSDLIVKSASSEFSDSGSEAWSERVGDIRGEGRCDRPESKSSDVETPVTCIESTLSSDGDQPDPHEEIASDDCVACGVSDVESAPSSPEVNWNRASDDEAKVVRFSSDFVQSPECIDVPQVLYRSYR